MLKVNEFEHGYKSGYLSKSDIYGRLLHPRANTHYLYDGTVDSLLNGDTILKFVIDHFKVQAPRLDILRQYYLGENSSILSGERRVDGKKADHRAPHDFSQYIVEFMTGFATGIPIRLTSKNEEATEVLTEVNDLNDVNHRNSKVFSDLSIYGRAYELVYRDPEGVRFTSVDPRNAFVIYDSSIERSPLAAIHYTTGYDVASGKHVLKIEAYTEDEIISYQKIDAEVLEPSGERKAKDTKMSIDDERSTTHEYPFIPLHEWETDEYRKGDFERVIPLIDLYDAAQSDTANYMTDLNDALLFIKGRLASGSTDEETEAIYNEFFSGVADANIAFAQPEMIDGKESSFSMDYLYKKYDVSGSEAYKDRLANDIHKFSHVPDLNDSTFYTSTGESMKWKLNGLRTKVSTRQRFFSSGLLHRYKIIFGFLNAVDGEGVEVADASAIEVGYSENVPESRESALKLFINAGGKLSNHTLIEFLPFIKDADREMEKIEEEQLESAVNKNFNSLSDLVAREAISDVEENV